MTEDTSNQRGDEGVNRDQDVNAEFWVRLRSRREDVFGTVVGPCPFTYKDGHKCDGELYISSYVHNIRLLCGKKGNHGMDAPGQSPRADEWGLVQEELEAQLAEDQP